MHRPEGEDLDALLRTKLNRKVGRDRTIHLDRRLYEAPDGFSGETVEVRYAPYGSGRPVHFVRRGETTETLLWRLDLPKNAPIPRGRVEAAAT